MLSRMSLPQGRVEAWGRSAKNPVGGYIPPVMEALKLAKVEHNHKNNRKNNRMKAL